MRALLPPALIAAALLAGCGVSDPYADQQGADPAAQTTASADVAPPAAIRAASEYVVLSQTWTPETLREQYREQLEATTGELHELLEDAQRPTSRYIDAQSLDRASSTAEILSATGRLTGPGTAEVDLSVRVRTTTTESVAEQETPWRVIAEQVDGRWLVSSSTANPS